jgi:hypothetical protein
MPEYVNLRVGDTGVQSGHTGSRGTTTSGKDVSNCDVPLTRKDDQNELLMIAKLCLL